MRIVNQSKTTSWLLNSLGTIHVIRGRIVGHKHNQTVVIAEYSGEEEAKTVFAAMVLAMSKKEPVFIMPKAVRQETIPFAETRN